MNENDITSRWRLILGKNSEQHLNFNNNAYYGLEETLDYLYNRGDDGDGEGGANHEREQKGGQGASQLTIVNWLENVRELFPTEVSKKIEKHAIEEYEMVELLTDEKVLKSLEPNRELLKNILTFKNLFNPQTLTICKEIIKKVAEDLSKELEVEVKKSFIGTHNKNERSNHKVYKNFDVKYTIKKNLKNYDSEKRKLVIDKPYFNSNLKKSKKHKVIMLIDESGSMLDSVINSAILAGIFAKIPDLELNLVIFDTEVVDLSDRVDDPVEVLLSVQLGGGTDIGKALAYGSKLIENPSKTILILISDLCEGGDVKEMLSTMKSIIDTGTKLLALTAITDDSTPFFDRKTANKASALGVNVASMTPKNLANYIAEVLR